jgi:hypothetical protein
MRPRLDSAAECRIGGSRTPIAVRSRRSETPKCCGSSGALNLGR